MNSNQLYLMLVYSEAILSHMETEYMPQIRVALDACWSFLENKNKTGKELYSLLVMERILREFSSTCN